MMRTLLLAAPVLLGAGAFTHAYYPSLLGSPPAAVAPPPVSPVAMPAAVSKADIDALKQQVAMWAAQQQQFADEVAASYRVMSKISNAIHDDLLRAEAERAAERTQAAAVQRRFSNDASQFLKAVPR